MAKSLRSKSKRSFRSKKRESGKYAVADAARLGRLSARLASIKQKDCSIVAPFDNSREMEVLGDQPEGAVSNAVKDGEGMVLDEQERSDERPIPVSTHGPRGSRREEWRISKGMDPIPKRRGMNRQGGLAARRKAGRPSRRR